MVLVRNKSGDLQGVVENFYFDQVMWNSMSELSSNIEKLDPAHAILRG